MGRNNQQRRAAKAKERHRRASGQPSGSSTGPAYSAGPRRPDHVDPQVREEEDIARDLAEAIHYLSARVREAADIPIGRLLDRSYLPASRASVCRRLADLLLARIEQAWQGGWRPIDLHQFVGRELDARGQAAVGDAMAAQLSRYAAATLAPSWPEQLRTVGASCWWPARQDFVTARAGVDGFEKALRAALDVVALLSTLPVIERLEPLPGTARPQPTRRRAEVDPRLLARVRQLLAQAESTPYEAEADTFTAAAQSLMTRHSLDAAMLAAADEGHTDRPTASRVWVERPYEQEKVQLLNAVADANRCRTVWSSGLGFATVIGHSTDFAAVEAIFTSLLLQATRAMVNEGRHVTVSGTSRTRRFRRSFLIAYAARIGERLRAATDAETESVIAEGDVDGANEKRTGSRALVRVLAERSAEVDAVVHDLFPQLISKQSRFTPDAHGLAAGNRAAESASLFGTSASLDPARKRSVG